MKKISLLLCLSIALFANAQTVFVDIDNQTQNKLLEGYLTSPLPEIDEIDFSEELFISAIHQIPAFGLYDDQWDTSHLRSIQLNIPLNDEGLKIILVGTYNSPFIFPCRGDVVLHYGQQKRSGFHTGIDFQLNNNDPVYAVFDGVVRMAKYYGDYGKMVVIRHYNGLETIYSHLDKIGVKPGQIIKAGHVIGSAGNTGNVNNKIPTLLHFEVRFMNEYFNPVKMFNIETRSLNDNTLLLTSHDFNITPIPQKVLAPPENPPEKTSEVPSDSPSEMPTVTKPIQNELSTQEDSSVQYHTVKSGETLYRIASQYNTTVEEILKINNINNPNSIQEGKKLRVK